MEKGNRYTGSPEDLAMIGKSPTKQSTDNFINPGTPDNALVSVDDRKTGLISGAGTAKLREHMVPKG